MVAATELPTSLVDDDGLRVEPASLVDPTPSAEAGGLFPAESATPTVSTTIMETGGKLCPKYLALVESAPSTEAGSLLREESATSTASTMIMETAGRSRLAPASAFGWKAFTGVSGKLPAESYRLMDSTTLIDVAGSS